MQGERGGKNRSTIEKDKKNTKIFQKIAHLRQTLLKILQIHFEYTPQFCWIVLPKLFQCLDFSHRNESTHSIHTTVRNENDSEDLEVLKTFLLLKGEIKPVSSWKAIFYSCQKQERKERRKKWKKPKRNESACVRFFVRGGVKPSQRPAQFE
jgi:hypothetical protein